MDTDPAHRYPHEVRAGADPRERSISGDHLGPEAARRPSVELLWFSDCPNHAAASQMLIELVPVHAPGAVIRLIDATDAATATALRFPGSPTIRVDGVDIDPSFVDPGDYTPRCRLYRTAEGLSGLPDPKWIEVALRQAVDRNG